MEEDAAVAGREGGSAAFMRFGSTCCRRDRTTWFGYVTVDATTCGVCVCA